jgi:tRNA (adenine22-N1)-methyltransferase
VKVIIKLSKRLQAVAALTTPWRRIADIGSDHAHLPIYLKATDQIDYAVCGEVVEGPYRIARDHVQTSGYADQLIVRLADGLAAIEPADQIECAVIAGMGGMLITEILNQGTQPLQSLKALVLQPNQNVDVVRQWLGQHRWRIVAENLVFDENHYYQMMLAVPDADRIDYQPIELLMGPVMLQQVHSEEDFRAYWQFQLKQKQQLLAQLMRASEPITAKIQKVQTEIRFIKEGLDATDRSTNH